MFSSDGSRSQQPVGAQLTDPADLANKPPSSAPRSPLRSLRQGNPVAICLVLVVLVACLYLPSLRNSFVNYDDNLYVTDNPQVQAGVTWQGLVWAFARLHGTGTYWHPLTWVTHMLDCQLYGLRAWGHHLTNFLLHGANTLLVFLLFRRMTGHCWRSATLAALFALHPLQVDTVAWVAERKNLLGALFWLLTTWAYVRYLERPTFKRYALVLLLFTLGLMSKPVLVTLPFALLLLDYWPLGRFQTATRGSRPATPARLLWEKAPLVLLAAASCLVTLLAHRGLGMLDLPSWVTPEHRVENALVSYIRYLSKTLWPFNLAVFYPYPDAWPIYQAALSALLLVAASSLALRAAHVRPYVFVGWFWFLGVLVPFIGVFQVGAQAMADRFVYVPLLGLLIMAIWAAADLTARWAHRQALLALVGTATLAACGCVSHFQLKHWKNGVTLFSHAIAVTRNNALAECNLGNALGAQGRPKEAIPHLKEAIRLSPTYPEARINLGVALLAEGRIEEAVDHYRAAIAARPNYAQAHAFLAAALALQVKNDEAIHELREALRLKPDYADAHARLGNLLLLQGKQEEGLCHLLVAVELRDDCENGHYWLASALARQSRMQEAVVHFRAALRVQPDKAPALNDLAWILATEHEPTLRNVPEAIRLARRACEVSAHTNAAYLDTLGTALSEAARYPEAITVTETAASVAAAAGQKDLARQIHSHLQLYRTKSAGQPLLRPQSH